MFSVGGTVMEKNNFSLLRSKEIIAILDGDKDFGDLTFEDKYGNETKIKIAMPYLSGPAICELSSFFGLPATYSWSGGALSRWQYFDNIMAFCIKQNRMSDFLSYLFSKDKFVVIIVLFLSALKDKCVKSNSPPSLSNDIYPSSSKIIKS